MIPEIKKDILLLSSGKLYEIDIASNYLEEHRIPHYKQQRMVTGLRLAMPFQPFAGPGVWYSIYVNEKMADKAKQLMSELPFETTSDPGIWHFNPNKKAKVFWRVIVFFWLGSMLLPFLYYLWGLIYEI